MEIKDLWYYTAKYIPKEKQKEDDMSQESPVLGKQVGGTHYKNQGIQPWEIIEANGLDFWEGNVVKYVIRHQDKAGVKDLQKAVHYLEFMIENYNKLYT